MSPRPGSAGKPPVEKKEQKYVARYVLLLLLVVQCNMKYYYINLPHFFAECPSFLHYSSIYLSLVIQMMISDDGIIVIVEFFLRKIAFGQD